MAYIANAFSLQMLGDDTPYTIDTYPIKPEDMPKDLESSLGHSDIVRYVNHQLGTNFKENRASIKLEKGDSLYVAQIVSGRLKENQGKIDISKVKLRYYKIDIS